VGKRITQINAEALRAEARREEVDALATPGILDLSEPGIMSGAWSPPEIEAIRPVVPRGSV